VVDLDGYLSVFLHENVYFVLPPYFVVNCSMKLQLTKRLTYIIRDTRLIFGGFSVIVTDLSETIVLATKKSPKIHLKSAAKIEVKRQDKGHLI